VTALEILAFLPVVIMVGGCAIFLFGPVLRKALQTGVISSKRGDIRWDQSPFLYSFGVVALGVWVIGLPLVLAIIALSSLVEAN
jgi:hypothetical protein